MLLLELLLLELLLLELLLLGLLLLEIDHEERELPRRSVRLGARTAWRIFTVFGIFSDAPIFADTALKILGDSSKILKNMEDYYYY